jgi:dienelactone hydrolase
MSISGIETRVIANLLDQIDRLKAENSALGDAADGDCCPKGSTPALTVDYDAQGEESLIGDLPVYSVGDASSGRGVIVAYDIYGFRGGRIRNICDQLALATKSLVILPDFFRGDCWSQERTDKEPDEKMPFIKRISDPKSVKADILSVMGQMKKQKVSRMGFCGFCFGGYAAFIASQTGLLDCAIGVHSSIKIFNFHGSNELEAADKCTCPQMLLQASNDAENTKPGGEVDKFLATKPFGSECVFREFKDMLHGWVPRGDLSDPAVHRDVDESMSTIVGFLNEHMTGASSFASPCNCPCAVCTCGPDCKCKPGDAGCDPCSEFQGSMKLIKEGAKL